MYSDSLPENVEFNFDGVLLPSLPTVAVRLLELCRDPEADLEDIAKLVREDAALCMRYLKVANSAYTGWSREIATISEAFVVLGMKAVKTLAMGFSLVSSMSDRYGDKLEMNGIWTRSLAGAVAAQQMARTVGGVCPEEAFLAGLMRDIGIFAMVSQFGSEYLQVYKMAETNHRSLAPAERTQFGTDHAVAGAFLADHWKLPDSLIEPIRSHETGNSDRDTVRHDLETVVHVATQAAEVLTAAKPEHAVAPYQDAATHCLGLAKTQTEGLLHQARDAMKDVAALFSVKVAQLPDLTQILNNANEALLQVTLDTQKLADQLEEQNKALTEKIDLDPLTGLLNRGAFDRWLLEHRQAAADSGRPLSLMLIDVDHFKLVNDRFGHSTGDKVLRNMAEVMVRVVSAVDGQVCRYGGEEFGVLLPHTGYSQAVRLGEQVRSSVAKRPLATTEDGKALRVTVSVGVLTADRPQVVEPEALVKNVDRCTYAAKAAGRNCVRAVHVTAELAARLSQGATANPDDPAAQLHKLV